ncbi:Asp-tRNA(Asn)/Glu-tRNA(Gln) amidotransferase subunit GatA [Candidatus Roseilinea sp. NK_OTU-006]|jgi:aspartyl-tRNA(Asn)/glutamyl-tRNA(Gln) amidotransferase subunit A|uniref:Asp-tRNA(Asn)/Glu-tRNA(Gln) amidotransferase subunit GatA n=1 Tax=Candidatus Roseilinea sp. NK_OTU-006 TaxID=2704250 RepID=UPI00145E3AF0|nr:Asp-tRNA(Asn)/Glu-tRNA(Gln) amidotransferase subunit GatA [Candidatus Roseilinea sp. NK_OTU-006]
MLTVYAARERLRRREVSAVELTRAFLERIHALNPRLNAYLTVADETALAMAGDADARMARGEDTPLLGVPIAIKDVLSTRDMRTTAGSKILANYTPSWDATAVARLRAMGAVFLGKLNCDEFAMGSSTENSAFGPTRNPWDETRVPGGSSGGSAAAVAADLCCAALGTDTGGSIRQPAALCGVTGLKNSYGRVSRYGLIAFASSLDTVGALTKDARDAAIMLRAMEGRDPLDSTSVEVEPIDVASLDQSRDSLRGLRVGVPAEYFGDGMQPDVAQRVREAIAHLQALGASVREVNLPRTHLGLPVYYIIAPAEASANLARFDGVKYGLRVQGRDLIATYMETRGAGFGAEVKRRIMLGTYALSAGYYDAYYIRAQKVRTLIKRDFEQAFSHVDIIAAPVSPTTAFPLGAKIDDPIQMYLADVFTLPVSLAGICGISIPCGFDRDGLPVGLQLIGPAFGEQRVLEVAHVFQQTTDFHLQKPKWHGQPRSS